MSTSIHDLQGVLRAARRRLRRAKRRGLIHGAQVTAVHVAEHRVNKALAAKARLVIIAHGGRALPEGSVCFEQEVVS